MSNEKLNDSYINFLCGLREAKESSSSIDLKLIINKIELNLEQQINNATFLIHDICCLDKQKESTND